MIDHHCHILPGLDDGAGTLEESVEMARLLAEAGYTNVFCTPHCMRGAFDNTPSQVRTRVAELQSEISRLGIPLILEPGMEYFVDEFLPQHLADPLPLGETGLLLFELPSRFEPEQVRESVFQIARRGLKPLLAHPERHPLFSDGEARGGLLSRLGGLLGASRNSSLPDDSLGSALSSMGCGFQGNLGSFAGFYGRAVRRAAERMKGEGRYTHFGTDGHSAHQLRTVLKSGQR